MIKSLLMLSAGLLGVLPLIFTFINDELFETPKLIVVYLVAGLIGLGGLGLMLISGRKTWRRPQFLHWAVLAFVVTQIISTVLSIHPYTSLWGYYSRLHGGLLSTLAYTCLFFVWSQVLTRKQVRSLIWVILIGGLLAGLYAAPEHFGLSPSCILSSSGLNWGVDCWIQDVQNRVFGTLGQPNWLAAYIVLTLPVAISLFVHHFKTNHLLKSRLTNWPNYFLLAYIYLNYAVLLFTKSKSGFLALGVAGVFWLGLNIRRLSPGLTWLVGGGLLISLLFGTPYSPDLPTMFDQATHRLTTSSTSNSAPSVSTDALPPAGGTDSGVIRQIVWRGAWQVFLRYPIFGSGVETFAYSYYQDRPLAHNLVSEWDFLYNKAHNEFLNLLATTGLVGTTSYVVMLVVFIVTGWIFVIKKPPAGKTAHKIEGDQNIVSGMMAGVVALTVSNFFGFSTVSVTTVMYAFLAFVIVLSSNHDDDLTIKNEQKINPNGYLILIVLGFSSLVLTSQIVNYWRADVLYARSKALFVSQAYQDSVDVLSQAIALRPSEALYYDELSNQVAQLASALDITGDSSGAAQLATTGVTASDVALELNDRHLNFYKTRSRVFLLLSQINPNYLSEAEKTIKQAMQLAPTDAKLVYTLARIYELQGKVPEAATAAQDAISLKPNYGEVRVFLAQIREKEGDFDAAVQEYKYVLTHISPGDSAVTKMLASASAKLNTKHSK